MADQLRIKLSIADRVYPLTIKSNQEEGLRIAAKRINDLIKQFEESYAVRDKQDVLAMCALQFASQYEQSILDEDYEKKETYKRLNACIEALNKELLP